MLPILLVMADGVVSADEFWLLSNRAPSLKYLGGRGSGDKCGHQRGVAEKGSVHRSHTTKRDQAICRWVTHQS